jgi:hypothetical protein
VRFGPVVFAVFLPILPLVIAAPWASGQARCDAKSVVRQGCFYFLSADPRTWDIYFVYQSILDIFDFMDGALATHRAANRHDMMGAGSRPSAHVDVCQRRNLRRNIHRNRNHRHPRERSQASPYISPYRKLSVDDEQELQPCEPVESACGVSLLVAVLQEMRFILEKIAVRASLLLPHIRTLI